MEESEKRKERLKAMCTGAAHPDLGTQSQSALCPPSPLVNPLNQSFSAPTLDCSHSTQRFDYYTDPVSAFHGNKRKGSNRPFLPATGFQMNYPPYQGPRGFQSPNLQTGPWSNAPQGFQSPNIQAPQEFQSSNTQARPSSNEVQAFQSSNTQTRPWSNEPQGFQSPNLHGPGSNDQQRFQSPNLQARPWSNEPQGFQSPNIQARPWPNPVARGSSFFMQNPPRLSGSGYKPPDAFGPRLPYSNSSRGGFINSGGRGSNHFVYRGKGSYLNSLGRGSASTGGNLQTFFFKQMVEDPWKNLEPVVGNILEAFTTLGTTDSWFPKSIVTKKVKVNDVSKGSGTLSLAEYLAQSFEEAANDETET